ncbi:MAG TPA: DUF1343 domain-containing protein [Candidatus Marinimicrobia bacterium]|nr:DUF1343 domain-containing protein [Candidatus Neomarinimicrobiota bacterium]HRS52198.1 DUF1343 domain-containing protein [Candidatus Neomarinimicrobiota bacterium]HRU91989.1 DUF1343 domain-containing protein [Candidatus Neomarinimicrobiota bacterium]
MKTTGAKYRSFFRLLVVLALISGELNSQTAKLRHSTVLTLPVTEEPQNFKTGLDLLIDDNFNALGNHKFMVIAGRYSYSRSNQHIFDIVNIRLGTRCRSCVQVLESRSSSGSGFQLSASQFSGITRYFVLDNLNDRLSASMLNGAEVIVFDLPDSGIRESQAVKVLIEALRLSGNQQVPIIVLDRPNSLRGVETGGPMSNRSQFAPGLFLPARYGMTLGELALLINEENWLKTENKSQLTVIKMANYNRDMPWQSTGLKWSFADEVVGDEESAVLYAGLYFLQFTNISLGIGTPYPYHVVGAPWISANELINALTEYKLAGVEINPVKFIPRRELNANEMPLYVDTECSGISVQVSDINKFDTYEFSTTLISVISSLYPKHFEWVKIPEADAYFGNADFRTWVNIGADLKPMLADWEAKASQFQKLRFKYCLYPLQKN